MGVRGCDCDDGLALLYAVGKAVSEGKERKHYLGAICSSYGNFTLETVHKNTARILKELALDVPLYKGSAGSAYKTSDAARFLANAKREFPGEDLYLAVTGSTTNVAQAISLNPEFLQQFKKVVFMGGITETLIVGDGIMDELNLSIDFESTMKILEAAKDADNVAIITANNCLPCHFVPKEFEDKLYGNGDFFEKNCHYWFDDMKERYNDEGFVCWDALVPLYILEPELFREETLDVALDPRMLSIGMLEEASGEVPSVSITTPVIKKPKKVKKHLLENWQKAV